MPPVWKIPFMVVGAPVATWFGIGTYWSELRSSGEAPAYYVGSIGTTGFMVSEAGGPYEPSRSAFYIYVEDADQAHRTAVACGADDIHAPRDMDDGDRQGAVTDPSGNAWWISTRTSRESYD